MNEWMMLLLATTLGSLLSLIGGIFLLSKRISVDRVQRVAIPFAAGAMLAVAFLDLLPEALEGASSSMHVFSFVLCGFVLFFTLERFLSWFHHHHTHPEQGTHSTHAKNASVRSLVVVGDTTHNAIDGMVIGGAFLADPMLGVVTTVAIAAHEIPQEIGDFGALLSLGMRRRNVLLVNIISALITVVTASLVFGFGGQLLALQPIMLALTSGMFLYIAASDLIPTIHSEPSSRVANYQTLVLLAGIVIIGFLSMSAHKLMPHSESAHAEHETHQH